MQYRQLELGIFRIKSRCALQSGGWEQNHLILPGAKFDPGAKMTTPRNWKKAKITAVAAGSGEMISFECRSQRG